MIIRLQHVSEFKKGVLWMTPEQMRQYRRKIGSGRKVASAIRSLINTRGLQVECSRVLHEALLVPVLLCDIETMI